MRLIRSSLLFSAFLCVLALEPMTAQAQGQEKQAPIGHRQPTASSVGQEPDLSPADKKLKELDDALAKKLNSICRGC